MSNILNAPVTVTDEATWTAGTSQFVPSGGVYNDTATALTVGQAGTIRLTSNRAMHTNLRDHSGNELLGQKTMASSLPVVLASDQGGITVSGTITIGTGSNTIGAVTQASGPWTQNITQVGGNAVVSGGVNGTVAVGGNQATNSTLSTNTYPQLIAGSDYGGTPKIQNWKVDSSGNGQVAITNSPTVTANAGTNLNTSALALESGGNLATIAGAVSSAKVNVNISSGSIPAGTNVIGHVIADSGSTTAVTGNVSAVQTPSSTASGVSFFRNTGLSNTATAVKASAGNIYDLHVYNNNSTVTYFQIYNVASGSVTVGTTTPDKTYAVPAQGILDDVFTMPIGFSTAITVAATTGASNGTAPTNGLLVNIDYK